MKRDIGKKYSRNKEVSCFEPVFPRNQANIACHLSVRPTLVLRQSRLLTVKYIIARTSRASEMSLIKNSS